MFIILLNYKVEISELEKTLPAHRAYLKTEGFDKGLIIAQDLVSHAQVA